MSSGAVLLGETAALPELNELAGVVAVPSAVETLVFAEVLAEPNSLAVVESVENQIEERTQGGNCFYAPSRLVVFASGLSAFSWNTLSRAVHDAVLQKEVVP